MSQRLPTIERLEELWRGSFGEEYAKRNADAARGRGEFWASVLEAREVSSALEVGCNVGANLVWLAEMLGPERLAGVDVNERAVATARTVAPGADLRVASAYQLPFDDEAFDLVFTTGVLIHLAPEHVVDAVDEIVRCSRRFVLCGEYYAEELEEVRYRGHDGALFKRDWGLLYRERHPSLELRDSGFLPAIEGGWDDVTWWLFEKP